MIQLNNYKNAIECIVNISDAKTSYHRVGVQLWISI